MNIEHIPTANYNVLKTDGGNDLLRTDSLEAASACLRYMSGLEVTEAERETAINAIRGHDMLIRQKQEARAAKTARKKMRKKAKKKNRIQSNQVTSDLLLPGLEIDDPNP